MNYYKELLKIIPDFINNQQTQKEMFDILLVSHPKAVIDAFYEINGIVQDSPISVLRKIIKDFTSVIYSDDELKPIIDAYKVNKLVATIKEIRALTGLGLREVKDIHDVFRSHPIYDEL